MNMRRKKWSRTLKEAEHQTNNEKTKNILKKIVEKRMNGGPVIRAKAKEMSK
jgi:hypothetical protein